MNPTRTDLLISRIVDREDGPSHWLELDAVAQQTPPWQELLDALRLDATLRAAVSPARAAAQACALPAVPSKRSVPSGLGWVAALLVAVSWAITMRAGAPETVAPHALPAPAYESPGSMVGELSRVVMDTRPTADGQAIEVLYMRRVLERAVVQQAFQLAQDELGRPVPTQVSVTSLSTPSTY